MTATATPDLDRYSRHKERAAERSREKSRTGRDIAGDYPPPGNLVRRGECERDLAKFFKVYFPAAFPLPWSPDHLRVIGKLQRTILEGGQNAIAMPRSFGKTTMSLRACLWAMLYGHRRYVMLVGATDKLAGKLLKQVKKELWQNDMLATDFRQVCYPIRRLENNSKKCIGQHFAGTPTNIAWSFVEVIFPTMPDDACDGPNVSGSQIMVAGLTGAIRGPVHTLPNGEVIRPDLVVADDPQTRKSATSLAMTEERLSIVHGDVLGLAGMGQKISVVIPCTVIEKEDLADQLLDRKRNPQWQGERTKMVYTFPTNEKLWLEYADKRNDELRNDGDGTQATAFYAANREAMDAGAVVAWPEMYRDGELSAIQYAMNLLYDNKYAFWAERQNEPLQEESESGQLQAPAIAERVSGLERGKVPMWATKLTAYVDVQKKCLYWGVVAWSMDFTGTVIDYGTYPDQQRGYFTLSEVQRTLARAAPGAGLEGSIDAGLEKTAALLLGREWMRDDKVAMKIDRLLVDANWGDSSDTVYAWCRKTPFAALVMPAHGRYVGAASKPWSEYQKKPGEQLGFHWIITAQAGKRSSRHALIDTNFFKTFVAQRLTAAVGDKGALTLFGKAGQDHRMFSEHCVSEYFKRVQLVGRDRVVDEWRQRPDQPDNHYWDIVTGCAAAASMLGCSLEVHRQEPKRKRYSNWAEWQARAREGRR